MIISIYNRILFKFFPLRLVKRYTGKAARRMYFIREYEIANTQVYKAEFHRKHQRVIREDMRREYDKAVETRDAAQQRLNAENEKQDGDKTIKETLLKTVETKTKEIAQFKEQIDHIDVEINGYTEAVEGIRAVLPLLLEEIEQ